MSYPLGSLANWSPFRLDALGLVTLLGAEEVNHAIGALTHNRFTEYLPLFGSFLVASDKFTKPLPGYSLYNLSDGVYVPVINGWFSRWLAANLDEIGTQLTWELRPGARKLEYSELMAMAIGAVGNGSLIVLSALQGDFYGIANAIAMLISVSVRYVMVHGKRRRLNGMIQRTKEKLDEEQVKILITTPEQLSTAVFEIPRGYLPFIIVDFRTQSHLYTVARGIGWIAFAVHIVCIGQAFLLSQLLSVGLLASATILTILGIGNDHEYAGHGLRIRKKPVEGGRRGLLLHLGPTAKEEQVLRHYWQLPHKPEDVEKQGFSSDFWRYWDDNIAKNRKPHEVAGATVSEV